MMMNQETEEYLLKWVDHQRTIMSAFRTLLENGAFADCTLSAEGISVRAHKIVLSACSRYFETILAQQFDKHPIFVLKDVKFEELRAIIDYMYKGEVIVSSDQIAGLLEVAKLLQIKGLTENRDESIISEEQPGNDDENVVESPDEQHQQHTTDVEINLEDIATTPRNKDVVASDASLPLQVEAT